MSEGMWHDVIQQRDPKSQFGSRGTLQRSPLKTNLLTNSEKSFKEHANATLCGMEADLRWVTRMGSIRDANQTWGDIQPLCGERERTKMQRLTMVAVSNLPSCTRPSRLRCQTVITMEDQGDYKNIQMFAPEPCASACQAHHPLSTLIRNDIGRGECVRSTKRVLIPYDAIEGITK